MMIKPKAVADRWGVSLPTVYKLFHSGKLPGQRLSEKNIRFRLEDIEAYERASCNTSSSSIEVSTASTGEIQEDDPSVARLVRQMELVLNEHSQNSNDSPLFGSVRVIAR